MEGLLKEFVSYDRALRMKSLGFDEPCSAVYFGNGENELFTFNPSIAKETTIAWLVYQIRQEGIHRTPENFFHKESKQR